MSFQDTIKGFYGRICNLIDSILNDVEENLTTYFCEIQTWIIGQPDHHETARILLGSYVSTWMMDDAEIDLAIARIIDDFTSASNSTND